MTTFSTNTRTDLNARGRQLAETRIRVEQQVWRLIQQLPAHFIRKPVDPVAELEKAQRREAARRAADNLLR